MTQTHNTHTYTRLLQYMSHPDHLSHNTQINLNISQNHALSKSHISHTTHHHTSLHTSYHTSYITHHTSRSTHHTSHITHHTSISSLFTVREPVWCLGAAVFVPLGHGAAGAGHPPPPLHSQPRRVLDCTQGNMSGGGECKCLRESRRVCVCVRQSESESVCVCACVSKWPPLQRRGGFTYPNS